MNKKCGYCKETKPASGFNKRTAAKDGLQSRCKTCQKKVNGAYYRKHAARYKAKSRRRIAGILRESRRKLLTYYENAGGCADCGETDPVVLEFDHVRGKKKWNISVLLFGRVRPFDCTEVQEELAKCEVVCANCHRRRTSKQFNYWYEKIDTEG